ncbi:MAG: FAD-dependent monooxygenase, partial [Bacteroidota bacterium]
MQQKHSIQLLPSQAADDDAIKNLFANSCGVLPARITGFAIIKKSIDARSKQPWVLITATVFIDEPFLPPALPPLQLQQVEKAAKKVIIVGAGPAGLFAALRLIDLGIQPIIIERGKDVRARRRDLAAINKEGVINPESNYCFGEGGAGTYSDGKLYTRSNKRGNVQRILNLFVHFGANTEILYEAHPHIGTNKLPQIITTMREKIIERGGKILFEKKLVDFKISNNKIEAISTSDGDELTADAVILATGHSARDIF